MSAITNLLPPYSTQHIGEHRLIDVLCKHDVSSGRVMRVVFDLLVDFLFGRNPFDDVRTLTVVADDVSIRLKLIPLIVRRAAYLGAFVKHRANNHREVPAFLKYDASNRRDLSALDGFYPDYVESSTGNSVRLLRLDAARTADATDGYIVVCMARGRIGKVMQQFVASRLVSNCMIAVVQHRAHVLQECFPLGSLFLNAESPITDSFGGLLPHDVCARAPPDDHGAILRIGEEAFCAETVIDDMERALQAIGETWKQE